MLHVLAQVVDLQSEDCLTLHCPAHVFARHTCEVADGHVRLDVLEQADHLERREHRPVELLTANDGHLEHADGCIFDGAELLLDEARHALADDVMPEAVGLERLGDALCRRGTDAVDLHECLAGHQHDGNDRLEAGRVERLDEAVVATECFGDGRDFVRRHA